jgi:hypothetical protein
MSSSRASRFHTTSWSLVLAAAESPTVGSRQALGKLDGCRNLEFQSRKTGDGGGITHSYRPSDFRVLMVAGGKAVFEAWNRSVEFSVRGER